MTLVEIIGNQAVRIALLEQQVQQLAAANAELASKLQPVAVDPRTPGPVLVAPEHGGGEDRLRDDTGVGSDASAKSLLVVPTSKDPAVPPVI